jgi:penicillin-binding protein 2
VYVNKQRKRDNNIRIAATPEPAKPEPAKPTTPTSEAPTVPSAE